MPDESLKHPPLKLIPPPNVVVAFPDTYSDVVVAPVAVRLVATRLVAVALVKVALVENRLVKVPRVAVKIDAKKLVEVA